MAKPRRPMQPVVFGVVVYVALAAVLAVALALLIAPKWAALAPLLALCVAHPATRFYERRLRGR